MTGESSNVWASVKRRWPQVTLCVLVVVLFAIPFLTGPWAWQPLVMIIFGIAATQIGAMYRLKVLKGLFGAFALRDHLNKQGSEVPQLPNQDETKLKELKEVIETRLRPPNRAAQDAVDSYLNQWVGTWAMVILSLGIVFALAIRNFLGVPNPSWMFSVLVVVAIAVIALLIWNAMGRFTDPSLLFIYYGHKGIFPPSGAASLFRVFILILYGCLVFAASWPRSPDKDSKQFPNPPGTATIATTNRLQQSSTNTVP